MRIGQLNNLMVSVLGMAGWCICVLLGQVSVMCDLLEYVK